MAPPGARTERAEAIEGFSFSSSSRIDATRTRLSVSWKVSWKVSLKISWKVSWKHPLGLHSTSCLSFDPEINPSP
jgi:hypothetical protein